MWQIILAFFVAQLINVILGTIKSVVTIKGGKMAASGMTALAYGVNTFVIKVIADVDMWIAILISVVCNLVGVYFGLWITEKLQKEQLWKITVTVPSENITNLTDDLKSHGITYINYETTWAKYKVLDVFSKHKSESKIIKEIFLKYNAKYTINANDGSL